MKSSNPWEEFWENAPRSRHIEAEAHAFSISLLNVTKLQNAQRVLDFGCGLGHLSEALSHFGHDVDIWDPSDKAMVTARQRISSPNVRAIGDPRYDPSSGNYALIVVNSVVQYMTHSDLSEWLVEWKRLLAKGGSIIVSDVPVRGTPKLIAETVEWLVFCYRQRVLLSALMFSIRTFRIYQKAALGQPLVKSDEGQLEMMATRANLKVRRLPQNLTFRKGRASYLLRAGR